MFALCGNGVSQHSRSRRDETPGTKGGQLGLHGCSYCALTANLPTGTDHDDRNCQMV